MNKDKKTIANEIAEYLINQVLMPMKPQENVPLYYASERKKFSWLGEDGTNTFHLMSEHLMTWVVLALIYDSSCTFGSVAVYHCPDNAEFAIEEQNDIGFKDFILEVQGEFLFDGLLIIYKD